MTYLEQNHMTMAQAEAHIETLIPYNWTYFIEYRRGHHYHVLDDCRKVKIYCAMSVFYTQDSVEHFRASTWAGVIMQLEDFLANDRRVIAVPIQEIPEELEEAV